MPETVMTGKTSVIRNLCEYEWFQWVMYYQPRESYPDNKVTMGRYLGPATDVGSAMTYKILTTKGNFVCRSTVRPWTATEEANPVLITEREQFMVRVQEALGPAAVVDDFHDKDITPEFEYYADNEEDGFEGTPDEILPPTPEADDTYVGTNVMLPRGSKMAQGKVRKCACDNNENAKADGNRNGDVVQGGRGR